MQGNTKPHNLHSFVWEEFKQMSKNLPPCCKDAKVVLFHPPGKQVTIVLNLLCIIQVGSCKFRILHTALHALHALHTYIHTYYIHTGLQLMTNFIMDNYVKYFPKLVKSVIIIILSVFPKGPRWRLQISCLSTTQRYLVYCQKNRKTRCFTLLQFLCWQ